MHNQTLCKYLKSQYSLHYLFTHLDIIVVKSDYYIAFMVLFSGH